MIKMKDLSSIQKFGNVLWRLNISFPNISVITLSSAELVVWHKTERIVVYNIDYMSGTII